MSFLARIVFFSLFGAVFTCEAYFKTNQWPDRSVIAHLFEWKWLDIADECERFLGPKRYGAVQTSPASENLVLHLEDGTRPWYERYQVMSYLLTTRSGGEAEFLNMTTRCNKVGVRIYVDVVLNHMTGDSETNLGTAGSTATFANSSYPGVPYTDEHFHHPVCDIQNYDNATEVRVCRLVSLKDLNQTMPYVRQKIIDYLNKLISLGVAGFRVDAAKHMWPEDLKEIYNRLDNLNTQHGFRPNARAYFYQEVTKGGTVTGNEYTKLGDVTEFTAGVELSSVFRGEKPLKSLVSWGSTTTGMLPNGYALVFVDNHDTQRNDDVLTYKNETLYKVAIAFLLSRPYGQPRIMSSYSFDNKNQGPPSDENEEIQSPIVSPSESCEEGWVCEHRWGQIYQMVGFTNAVRNTDVKNWWDNGNNQIAFSRGNKGFIAFNTEGSAMDVELQTGLPSGNYCDVISGQIDGNACTGKMVTVLETGKAQITLSGIGEELHLAIHVGAESLLQTSR